LKDEVLKNDKNGLNVVLSGLPGMNISALVALVQAMVNRFGLPHALVIHYGGNDIGMGSIREVLKHLIYATFIVCKMLQNSLLIRQAETINHRLHQWH
jgi:hypothetical protein